MHVLINHDTMIRKGRWLKNKKEWGRAWLQAGSVARWPLLQFLLALVELIDAIGTNDFGVVFAPNVLDDLCLQLNQNGEHKNVKQPDSFLNGGYYNARQD
jgi:hypothetical protein